MTYVMAYAIAKHKPVTPTNELRGAKLAICPSEET